MTSKVNENHNDLVPLQENLEIEDDPLYVMSVELEKGKNESIKIYSESKPEELSYEFCKRYNLDFVSLSYLTEQIKILLENGLNSNNPQLTSGNNPLRNKSECIMEVDEEDVQTSDPRDISNSNNNISHSLEEESEDSTASVKPNYDDLNNQSLKFEKKHKKGYEEGNPQFNESMEPSREQTEENIKDNQPLLSEVTRHSLFSYEEFYNNFKNKIKERQKTCSRRNNKNYNNHNTNSTFINHNKTINSKQAFSLSENGQKLKDFLQRSNNLDEIYQNKYEARTNLMNRNRNQSHNIRKTQNTVGSSKVRKGTSCHFKAHTNSINQSNKFARATVIRDKITTKSVSNRPQKVIITNFGQRLYQRGFQMKVKTNKKLNDIKQKIEQARDNENAFHPSIYKHNPNKNHPFDTKKLFNRYNSERITSKNNKTNRSYIEKYKGISQSNTSMKDAIAEEKQLNTFTQNDSRLEIRRPDIIYNRKKEEVFNNYYNHLHTNQDKMTNTLALDKKNLTKEITRPIIQKIKNKESDIKKTDFVTGI